MGDREPSYEVFTQTSTLNFENPNVNIAIPVFIINGNHDCLLFDFENRSAQDVLEVNSYLNRFGQDVRPDG